MLRKSYFVILATLILTAAVVHIPDSAARSFTTKSLKLNETTSYDIVQVSKGFGSMQVKINSSLEQAMTEWVQSDYLWMASSEWSIVFQSKDYLTICYKVLLNEGDASARFFQTIDLHSGSRVFLKDFISDKQTFVAVVHNTFPNFTDDELIAIYEYASLSENDFLDLIEKGDPFAREFALSYLKDKPDFYLSNNGIIIKMSSYSDDDIFISFDGHVEYTGREG